MSELLQIMQVTRKTGALKIEGERRGRILFRDGTVVGADLTGSRLTYLAEDRQTIADVLYVLASLDRGSFSVSSVDVSDQAEGWSVEEMLADVEGLAKLEAAVDDAGLIGAAGVRVTETIGGMIQLEPGDWRVLAKLVQPFNFDHLESRFGRGGAVRALYTLLRLDVAETVSGDETQFLDRLAEGIVGDSSEPTWLETHGSVLEEAGATPVVEAPPAPQEPAPAAVIEPPPPPAPQPEPAPARQPTPASQPDLDPEPRPAPVSPPESQPAPVSSPESQPAPAAQAEPVVEPAPQPAAFDSDLVAANRTDPDPVSAAPEPEAGPEPEPEPVPDREPRNTRGVSADASTTLTDGVYDEIRRLRSKAAEK